MHSTQQKVNELSESLKLFDEERAEADAATGQPLQFDGSLEVALSGGGYRATLHGLGALLYLVDAGLNWRVNSIISVSGGSIASAAVAREGDFSTMDSETFDKIVRNMVDHIAGGGISRCRAVRVYLTLVVVLMLGTCAVVTRALLSPSLSWAVAALCSPVLLATLWLLRGTVLTRALGRAVVGRGTLEEIASGVDHVFCATDLNHGLPVFFRAASGLVIWPGLGDFDARGLRLDSIVRASAAFPGGFPPKRIRTRHFYSGHNSWRRHIHISANEADVGLKHVGYLADGGVWNNLATSWWDDVGGAQRRTLSGRSTFGGVPGHRLVVDSSTRFALRPTRLMAAPVIGEVVGIGRVLRILYHNTVGPRSDVLLKSSGRATRARIPEGLLGPHTPDLGAVMVRLDSSPADLWAAYEASFPPVEELVDVRARLWRRLVGKQREFVRDRPIVGEAAGEAALLLDEITELVAAVATTLGPIDRRKIDALLAHGYYSTMGGFWIVHGIEPAAVVSMDRFDSLADTNN